MVRSAADEIRIRDRREHVVRMCAEGLNDLQIAQVFHVSERTIERDRERLGLTQPTSHQWTADELRLASNLLDDGCTYSEVARTIGVARDTVRFRFPGQGYGGGLRGQPLGNGKHMRLAEELGLTLMQ